MQTTELEKSRALHDEYLARRQEIELQRVASQQLRWEIVCERGLIPLWYVIVTDRDEQQWNIVRIEIYADSALKVLVHDDLQIFDLPKDSQDKIYAALRDEEIKNCEREIFAATQRRNAR